MTTSFTRTREELGAMVLRKLRTLARGGTAAAADLTIIYEAVDLRLKEMHRLGIYWRKVPTAAVSFSVSAGVNSASATADILFPIQMTVTDTSRDSPMDIIGIREYAALPDKTQTGLPTKAMWQRDSTFVLWPVPTATTTAKLVYEKIADDTAASTAPDVDVAMLRWLKDIIAYDLGDDFGMPNDVLLRFKVEAEIAEKNIRKLNAQHVDFTPVAVDDFDSRRPGDRSPTDYNRNY